MATGIGIGRIIDEAIGGPSVLNPKGLALRALVGLIFSLGMWVGFNLLASAAPCCADIPPALRTCSTFVMAKGGALLVGHNLDETIEVPGHILVQPRGITRTSLGYADMGFPGVAGPRIRWTSRFGSIVASNCGREFIDGGLNEAGLYVGEMSLLGSAYPADPGRTRIYHHAWMQYLLDNFSKVEEAIASLASVVPDGHCQWHFLLADRAGGAALVQFEEGRARIYSGATLPVPAATNYTYPSCLKKLATFAGFGGDRALPEEAGKEDLRFVHAAAALQALHRTGRTPDPEAAFALLQRMGGSTNRWSLVFDLKQMRLCWTSHRSRRVKSAAFAAFDFTAGRPLLSLDLHHDVAGDAAAAFTVHTREQNRAAVARFWRGVDAGALGNLFWKPRLVQAMQAYAEKLE